MAMSKAHLFGAQAYRQSQWNQANAHPARTLILEYLKINGQTPFKTIRKLISDLSRTTVSQHLTNLRKKGFIIIHEDYPYSAYSLEEKTCRDFAILMKNFDATMSREPASVKNG
jgi:DNA-binding HxlR family transcriptional regulator